MRIDNITPGMKLKIMKIDVTDRRFSSGDSMSAMVGKTYTVDNVNKDNNEIRLGGWSWCSEDLEMGDCEIGDSISEAMFKEKILFNPDELII
jgi:hypothetical protein